MVFRKGEIISQRDWGSGIVGALVFRAVDFQHIGLIAFVTLARIILFLFLRSIPPFRSLRGKTTTKQASQ